MPNSANKFPYIANEQWMLVEYVSNYSEYLNAGPDNLKLATPEYINSINSTNIETKNKNIVTNICNNTDKDLPWYGILTEDNRYLITNNLSAGTLIIGPIFNKELCIQIFKIYLTVNNYIIED